MNIKFPIKYHTHQIQLKVFKFKQKINTRQLQFLTKYLTYILNIIQFKATSKISKSNQQIRTLNKQARVLYGDDIGRIWVDIDKMSIKQAYGRSIGWVGIIPIAIYVLAISTHTYFFSFSMLIYVLVEMNFVNFKLIRIFLSALVSSL